MLKTYIVEVTQTRTITRTARLLIQAPEETAAVAHATLRANDERSLPPCNEIIDATPWDVRVLDSDGAKRLAQLITHDRYRPGPLDFDELEELQTLRLSPHLSIADEEHFLFGETSHRPDSVVGDVRMVEMQDAP